MASDLAIAVARDILADRAYGIAHPNEACVKHDSQHGVGSLICVAETIDAFAAPPAAGATPDAAREAFTVAALAEAVRIAIGIYAPRIYLSDAQVSEITDEAKSRFDAALKRAEGGAK